jgi:hypothetical protein
MVEMLEIFNSRRSGLSVPSATSVVSNFLVTIHLQRWSRTSSVQFWTNKFQRPMKSVVAYGIKPIAEPEDATLEYVPRPPKPIAICIKALTTETVSCSSMDSLVVEKRRGHMKMAPFGPETFFPTILQRRESWYSATTRISHTFSDRLQLILFVIMEERFAPILPCCG